MSHSLTSSCKSRSTWTTYSVDTHLDTRARRSLQSETKFFISSHGELSQLLSYKCCGKVAFRIRIATFLPRQLHPRNSVTIDTVSCEMLMQKIFLAPSISRICAPEIPLSIKKLFGGEISTSRFQIIIIVDA